MKRRVLRNLPVEVWIVAVERDLWRVSTPSLALSFTVGGRLPLGWALRAVPAAVATSPRWSRIVAPVAERLVPTAGGRHLEPCIAKVLRGELAHQQFVLDQEDRVHDARMFMVDPWKPIGMNGVINGLFPACHDAA